MLRFGLLRRGQSRFFLNVLPRYYASSEKSPFRMCLDEVPPECTEEEILNAWRLSNVLIGDPLSVEKIPQNSPANSFFVHLRSKEDLEFNTRSAKFGLHIRGNRCDLSDAALRTTLEVRPLPALIKDLTLKNMVKDATSITPNDVFVANNYADIVFATHHYAYTAFNQLNRPLVVGGQKVSFYWKPTSATLDAESLRVHLKRVQIKELYLRREVAKLKRLIGSVGYYELPVLDLSYYGIDAGALVTEKDIPSMEELMEIHLLNTLYLVKCDRQKACQVLGLTPDMLRRRLDKLGFKAKYLGKYELWNLIHTRVLNSRAAQGARKKALIDRAIEAVVHDNEKSFEAMQAEKIRKADLEHIAKKERERGGQQDDGEEVGTFGHS